jgi:hypothetical protein
MPGVQFLVAHAPPRLLPALIPSVGIEPRRTTVSDHSQKAISPHKRKPRAKSVPAPPVNPCAPPTVYALRVWSVKKVSGKWYISQAARFDDKEAWIGPYDSVYRATTAIARKLTEEIIQRHRSRCQHYGIDD